MRSASSWVNAALAAALGLGLCVGAQAAPKVPGYVEAAVADSGRPQSDTKRDAERKPAEALAFAGVKPGEKVAELIPAAGYYTRMLSKIVGPSGHVYMLAPPPRPNARPGAPNMMEMANKIAQNPEYSNVSVVSLGPSGPGFGLPEKVDLVWTSDNYHDFHNGPSADIAAFNKRVYDTLKAGGVYFVLDHAAAAGAGPDVTHTLHRIDPAQAKKEIEAAGFKFAGQSRALHNPQDPHTKMVFDPSIRGHTDQFMFKFRKP